MTSPVSSIPNLGPASEAAYARAGLTSAEEIRALGPDESYRRLLLSGERPHFIGYYVLVMGLQGRPWNDCQGAEKAALRRHDAETEGAAHRQHAGHDRSTPIGDDKTGGTVLTLHCFCTTGDILRQTEHALHARIRLCRFCPAGHKRAEVCEVAGTARANARQRRREIELHKIVAGLHHLAARRHEGRERRTVARQRIAARRQVLGESAADTRAEPRRCFRRRYDLRPGERTIAGVKRKQSVRGGRHGGAKARATVVGGCRCTEIHNFGGALLGVVYQTSAASS